MKFIHRLSFYLGGFIIGLILLFFFLSGKKTSCDYGPEARVLKNIRTKPLFFSENTLQVFSKHQLDTSIVTSILKNADVIFSESNTELDSCKQYMIKSVLDNIKFKIRVENCEHQATVLDAYLD